jgi:hypothetical protein
MLLTLWSWVQNLFIPYIWLLAQIGTDVLLFFFLQLEDKFEFLSRFNIVKYI